MERDPHVRLLDEALDRVLTVRLDLTPLEVTQVPELALDAALAMRPNYIDARAKTDDALKAVMGALPMERRHLALDLEAALRDEEAIVVDVAFSLGVTATGGGAATR